jgi:hypothetical protein
MEFKVASNPSWKEPLGSDVLIVDMDTRWPDGDNEVFGKTKLNWENVTGTEGGSMLTAAVLNHFMYGTSAFHVPSCECSLCEAKHPLTSHHSSDSRLRLQILPRRAPGRAAQYVDKAIRSLTVSPIIPLRRLHRCRCHHPASRRSARVALQ